MLRSTASPLDLVLKSFVSSSQFLSMSDKNWEAIASLIPGTSPQQCERRYSELIKLQSRAESQKLISKNSGQLAQRDREQSDTKLGRTTSAKSKGLKIESEGSETSFKSFKTIGEHGPKMVIHVCDEAKNLKEDFHCARDLLVTEMKYFAEYLSNDAQRWEEVDISVHCDVQIFDWLMKYVKRGTKEVLTPPKLEPGNVISILISSDFLKMDSLVQECIEYCHENLGEIVATPCNMNCINDVLATRIADLFTHNEADEVKDKKDKFKSKLFAKKLEKLFEAGSGDNASTLFRCSMCQRLLTKTMESKVRCLQNRMTVDRFGNLTYRHVNDPSWDVNDYLMDLKANLKTWRDVYWRVWGVVNYLTCSRCGEVFSCSELGHCRYHPEGPKFEREMEISPVGEYPCCGDKVLRFDPTQPNMGCKVRDHIVNLPEEGSQSSSRNQLVCEDLFSHRDVVCLPFSKETTISPDSLNVFANEEFACWRNSLVIPGVDVLSADTTSSTEVKPRLEPLTVERLVFNEDDIGIGESEEDLGDDESVKGQRRNRCNRVTVDPQAILLDAPDFSTFKSRKWDATRSVRWNQDAQREEDQRRMNEICTYLTKLRLGNMDKLDKSKQREYPGGLYTKVESQWRALVIPTGKTSASSNVRSKGRLSQGKL